MRRAAYDETSIPRGTLKVGLFGVGLDTYWTQFPGLKERLERYTQGIAERVAGFGVRVVNLGLIDNADSAVEAGHEFRREDVDLIFLYVATYALSSTVVPVLRRPNVPVVILNLSPGAAIDYESFNRLEDRTQMTGEWLAWCQACPVPEIANALNRCGISFHQVNGTLQDDPEAWTQIEAWVEAAIVVYAMEHNRLGLMGHYYGGMLDVYADLTQQVAYFGGHVEIIEVEQLAACWKQVSVADIDDRVQAFRALMDIQTECATHELMRAARTSVALDRLVERHRLGSFAYYHQGTGSSEHQDMMSSIILGTSLLTGRGIPVAGEYEVKNAQAMKIMDSLGAGGSFTEYYAVDYNDGVVLMGHDGPGHIAIAEGRTRVRPLSIFHGKVGQGLSVEMSVKHGPVTLLAVVHTGDGKLKLVSAEGESVHGPILKIGNTNSRYRFSLGPRGFMEAWNAQCPAHHWAVGIGHIAHKVKKVAALLGMEAVQVC
jgi:L-arabinose isomerase